MDLFFWLVKENAVFERVMLSVVLKSIFSRASMMEVNLVNGEKYNEVVDTFLVRYVVSTTPNFPLLDNIGSQRECSSSWKIFQ